MNHHARNSFFVLALAFLSLFFTFPRLANAETTQLDLTAGTLRVVPRDETSTPILPETLPAAAQRPDL